MPWKKDLARLKQDLKQEDPAPPKPPPKAVPAAPVSRSIEEEDEIFLNAMGLRPKARKEEPRAEPPPPPLVRAASADAAAAPATFATAMGDLKGVKPMRRATAQEQPARPVPVPLAAPEPAPAPPCEPAPSGRTPEAGPEAAQPLAAAEAPRPALAGAAQAGSALAGSALAGSTLPGSAQAGSALAGSAHAGSAHAGSTLPGSAQAGSALAGAAHAGSAHAEGPGLATQINLAAGMAIEVDGVLDLRGHARSDGEERLKERILDGYALGWRTLHVHLGASPELSAMLMALLKSPEGRCIARYAQAPIPMGGPQSWVLYFRPAGPQETP